MCTHSQHGQTNQKEVCMTDSRDKDRGIRKKYATTDGMAKRTERHTSYNRLDNDSSDHADDRNVSK